ncbi:MAG TPA: sialate O-acetylesterase, partial [Candidatus Methylacidiphilales bacterium]
FYTAQNIPSYLFNGMIHPLIPAAFAGVLWYQGEANTDHARQYQAAFSLMIADWRAKWGRGDFPFFFCQLPVFWFPDTDAVASVRSKWAEMREAQTRALALPNTGEAVLIDAGEAQDIHPADKATPADRLARLALARVYGKKIADAGPIFDSMGCEGSQIRIRFRHADGGLVAKPLPATYFPKSSEPKTLPLPVNSPGSEVQGFVLCGADGVWHWAMAKIDGDSVVVSSPEVPDPAEVRYAWAQFPACNLYNGAGLPAEPFRTDAFPGLTDALLYGDMASDGPGSSPTPGALPAK